ncbi:hypothetical protein KPL37_13425 [Clostridium frigoris]|uniref:Major facilitator superfamily (MFS) profile domain-containing protein n=1 Tax=Clostridium frigoris TaxID=205327 RepID=A0ABS6BUZ6_9CLOT|nr:hypothetical protein [Clostridium frigoris]MBU3160744.1 hypothetical protein [Clostridium frigoris]
MDFKNINSKTINSNIIIWLSIATFLADIGGGLVNVVLPLYLTALEFNKTFIGTVEGIADFTSGIVRIFSGWLSSSGSSFS